MSVPRHTLGDAPIEAQYMEQMNKGASDWRWIPGWEGLYQAHPDGSIRSVDRRIADANGKRTRTIKGTVLRPQRNSNGLHHHVGLARDGSTEVLFVHALIALTFIGPRPDGHEVRHLDCDGYNNRAGNLAYGTRSENRGDSIRAGTIARGERHGSSKLTDDQALQVRLGDGTASHVAERYGVSAATVRRIRSGEAWAHLDMPEVKGGRA